MQLNCPECGQPVKAEHINIQEMAAVCPSCDAVFKFEPQAPKVKHRKVKRPKQLTLYEGYDEDSVHMAFRTNFRLDQDESFMGKTIFASIFGVMTILMFTSFITTGKSLILPLFFAALTAFSLYLLALHVYNSTHVDMDEDHLTITRKPLPNFDPVREVDLDNVITFRCEETPASVREKYDTPRFNVYAETHDGQQNVILKDMVGEYGLFITQVLNERLTAQLDETPIQATTTNHRLADEPDHKGFVTHDGELSIDDVLNHSAKRSQR